MILPKMMTILLLLMLLTCSQLLMATGICDGPMEHKYKAIAKKQKALQSPKKMEQILEKYPELEMAIYARPHGNSFGSGDFHKVIELQDNRLCIIVGDVEHHGDKVSEFSLKLNRYFDKKKTMQLLNEYKNPNEILLHMNNNLDFTQHNLSISMIFLNPKTGKIEFAGAGTPDLFIKSLDGSIKNYRKTGYSLKSRKDRSPNLYDQSFTNSNPYLSDGDMVIQISDGAIDNLIPLNGTHQSSLGKNRLMRILEDCHDCSPKELISIFKKEFGTTFDDTTMLIWKWNP